MWARAAAVLALLVGVVPELMVAHAFGGNGPYIRLEDKPTVAISVAKSCEAGIPESVQIADQSPNVQNQFIISEINSFGFTCREKLGSPHDCSRWNYIFPIKISFLDRKIIQSTVLTESHIKEPRYITSRDIADISNADMCRAESYVSQRINPVWVDGEIGALEDFCIARLTLGRILARPPQSDCCYPQSNCRNGEYNCEGGNNGLVVVVTFDDLDTGTAQNPNPRTEGGAIFLIIVVGGLGMVLLWYQAGKGP